MRHPLPVLPFHPSLPIVPPLLSSASFHTLPTPFPFPNYYLSIPSFPVNHHVPANPTVQPFHSISRRAHATERAEFQSIMYFPNPQAFTSHQGPQSRAQRASLDPTRYHPLSPHEFMTSISRHTPPSAGPSAALLPLQSTLPVLPAASGGPSSGSPPICPVPPVVVASLPA